MNITDKGELHLVEDSHEVREQLVRALHRAGYTVHGYESADSFFGGARIHHPSVLVLDMRLPGSSGLEIQQRMAETGMCIPTVFISGQSASDEIIRAFRGGATEFLWKPFQIEELLQAISVAMDKSRRQLIHQKKREDVKRILDLLTPRECEILPLLVRGYSNKRIASLINIQPDTAKKHRTNILDKLGMTDLSQLVEFFIEPDFSDTEQVQ